MKTGYHHGNLRQALIAEARDLIQKHGSHALTMRDLGKRLGVTRTAPYRHFKDRKALISAVAEESAQAFAAALHEVRVGEGNAMTRLRRMGRAYQAFARRDPCGYRLMFHETQLLNDPDPNLKETMNRAFEELRMMVEECQASNILKPGDSVQTATFIWSTSHGMATLIIDERLHPETDIDALQEFLERSLFEGVGRKSLDALWQRLQE